MRPIPFLILGLGVLLGSCALFTTTTTVTTPSATYICTGETGCCCNSPIQHASPSAGRWPDCAMGYECVAMQPGGVIHPNPLIGRIDVNLCRSRLASPAVIPQIASTQPAYCRTDLTP
ncbi:MAG: hypothetical protein AB1593_08875 [Pseudomonadota bacterium]